MGLKLTSNNYIRDPDDPRLDELCQELCQLSDQLQSVDDWPRQQLQLCASHGVFRWFLPEDDGGFQWSGTQITRGYLKLAQACLTTTFVITQRAGACRRISNGRNENLRHELLSDLNDGKTFATVGISHLTTSRQHVTKPVLLATDNDDHLVLNGYSPWVTGAPQADTVVVGAVVNDSLDNEQPDQVLIAVPMHQPGITTPPPPELIALSASQTGQVVFENVIVDRKYLIAGPSINVMQRGSGATTGSYQTSTLALGLARSAIDFLFQQSGQRTNLVDVAEKLDAQWTEQKDVLISIANGQDRFTNDELRTAANSLVLRSTQAAMTAAKGAGFVAGHPVGRWCTEALFFLVWSCPQGVIDANLCELVGSAQS